MSYTKAQNSTGKGERWSNFKGVMRVFGRTKEGKNCPFVTYCTSIGSKKPGTDEYLNFFIDVSFTRENDPEKPESFEIFVNQGFLTTRAVGDKVVPVAKIIDFDLI